jgi:phenylacetic acid degradation operon negative regulatory protein
MQPISATRPAQAPLASPPTAKALIQTLLLAAEGEAYPSRQLVAAGALYGVSENNIRVALVRLQAEGLAEAAGRGSYRLGQAAASLGRAISAWRQVESRLLPWLGHYIGVHVGALARSDRPALARRQRALHMLGLREVGKGLFVRPDNLQGGVAQCREQLYALGLDREAWVFSLQEPCAELSDHVAHLWDLPSLSQSYRDTHERLSRWLAQQESLPPDQAAREAYLLDRPAVRQVVWDPLLPEEWIDGPARSAMFATVRDFDAAGRSIWWRFFQFSEQALVP